MSARLLDVAGVAHKLSLSKSSVWLLAKTAAFPVPIRINSNTRWIESEINAWIRARAKERSVPSLVSPRESTAPAARRSA